MTFSQSMMSLVNLGELLSERCSDFD